MRERGKSIVLESGCVEYSRVIQGLYLHKVEEIFQAITGDTRWKKKFQEMVIAQYGHLFV